MKGSYIALVLGALSWVFILLALRGSVDAITYMAEVLGR